MVASGMAFDYPWQLVMLLPGFNIAVTSDGLWPLLPVLVLVLGVLILRGKVAALAIAVGVFAIDAAMNLVVVLALLWQPPGRGEGAEALIVWPQYVGFLIRLGLLCLLVTAYLRSRRPLSHDPQNSQDR